MLPYPRHYYSNGTMNWYIELVDKYGQVQFLWYKTRAKARWKAAWYKEWAAVESAVVRKVS
jgi:hypothetical protein